MQHCILNYKKEDTKAIQFLLTFSYLRLRFGLNLIKTNNKIESLNICDCSFLYSAYADDTTLFFKNVLSAIEIIAMIDYFSSYLGLKSDISKCKISGTGALKRVHMALCG